MTSHTDIGDQVGRAGNAPPAGPASGFLGAPPASPDAQRMYDEDLAERGYVMNVSRLWAHQPNAQDQLSALIGKAAQAGCLTLRQRGILVTACAATLGDSYCALAWGNRLAAEAGAEIAAGVLRGDDDRMDPAERVLAHWARRVARDPNHIEAHDVDALRAAGFDDAQIFAITRARNSNALIRPSWSSYHAAARHERGRSCGRAALRSSSSRGHARPYSTSSRTVSRHDRRRHRLTGRPVLRVRLAERG